MMWDDVSVWGGTLVLIAAAGSRVSWVWCAQPPMSAAAVMAAMGR